MLSPGVMVKDHEIIAPLRSGGMAVLFLARPSVLSLGVLCLAFGVVLGMRMPSEPAGTVRRLPSGAAFRRPLRS